MLPARSKRAWLLGSFAALSAACSAVLGLDPPQLDPCPAGCVDASPPLVDATPGEASGDTTQGDAANDAVNAPDQGPIVGTRCGGGATPATGCNGATRACCEITDDAGGNSFVCRASSSSCEGYPILCAYNGDCSGNDVCCYSATEIKCASSCTDNTAIVCEPDGATDQCPSGWKCGAALTNGGTLPYFGCTR